VSSPARRAAVRVLARVATEGAWASPTLDAEIGRARLERRDAALATEIVYGALRVLPELDAALDAHLSKPGKLDPFVRAALRAGAYQLLHLSRVPPHAAVSETVALVKSERGPRLAGLVNAVLRKVAAQRPEAPEPPQRMMLAPWIEARVRDALGDRGDAFFSARQLPPPLGLRAVGATTAEELAGAIREAHPEAEVNTSALAPRAVLVRGAGDPRALPGWDRGAFAVQELGSQIVLEHVGAEPGERIADLCAGHGTKSLALAERAREVVAVDLYEEKLERLEKERARLIPSLRIETCALDLTVGTGGLDASFDRVVVDAPCTGLGTVHRRPELALRLTPDDPARMAELQLAIASTAIRLVRPGGMLVYAVCSPTNEEGRDVAARLEAAHPGQLERTPPRGADPDGIVRIGQWLDGADAYQLVRWRRTRA
jgi:16S rRNA (cytosine967-C5)-methyltransferase